MATHVIIMQNYNVFRLPLYEIWPRHESVSTNEKSAKRILKNIVYFSIKTHFMVIVQIDDLCESTERDRGPDPASWL